jgi:multisubunit Na+/H+ antiporter MnhB subunit
MRIIKQLSTLLLIFWAGILVWAVWSWPGSPVMDIPTLVAQKLSYSGVDHPVTAVLLNYRAYDTLLEIAVLLLAVLGVWTVFYAHREASDSVLVNLSPLSPLLTPMLSLSVPVLVLAAAYLLWAGAYTSGGAFQAGAVLSGAGVLLRLSGAIQAKEENNTVLRFLLGIGLLVFGSVGVAVMWSQGALLTYPLTWAGGLILLIEASLTVSIAMSLLLLFVGSPGVSWSGKGQH